MSLYRLTLLSGTQLILGETQKLILPEDHGNSGLYAGDEVVMENELREVLGTAVIRSVQVMPYALLQQYHFNGTAHNGLTSWHDAADTLRRLVPGFSITDRTTVLEIETVTLLEPSLTINEARTAAAEPEEEGTDLIAELEAEHEAA
jgi:hypothetical protein